MQDQIVAVEKVNMEKGNAILTPEIEKILENFLTKQMIRILLLLFRKDLSNKEMAYSMGIASNALSNILQRMKQSQIELLKSYRKEKYIMYTLSPIASQYVEEKLLCEKRSNIRLFSVNDENDCYYTICIRALDDLRKEYGNKFELEFSRLLMCYYRMNKDTVESSVKNFLENLENLIIRDQEEMVNSIEEQLGDVRLTEILQDYIGIFLSIRKLCKIDTENWESAYELADELLAEGGNSISFTFLEKNAGHDIDAVIEIGKSLLEMVKEASQRELDKKGFLAHWGKYFLSHERLAYYIAEKYAHLKRG